MMNNKTLRLIRSTHNSSLAILVFFFALIIITGILLTWKKNSYGYLMPQTHETQSGNLGTWISADSMAIIAINEMTHNQLRVVCEIDRIDLRPGLGIAKITFKNNFYEVQLDGATGKVLNIGKRRSDFIESLHDGSFIDNLLNNKHKTGKLVYGSLIGLALLFYTLTGFTLWYQKEQRKKNRKA